MSGRVTQVKDILFDCVRVNSLRTAIIPLEESILSYSGRRVTFLSEKCLPKYLYPYLLLLVLRTKTLKDTKKIWEEMYGEGGLPYVTVIHY